VNATVARKELIAALTDLGKIPTNRLFPILASVYVVADSEHIAITHTDLDTTARILINATVTESGATCLSRKGLLAILRSVKADSVVFETEGVNIGGAFLPIEHYDTGDFPMTKELDSIDGRKATLDAESLLSALQTLEPVISRDEVRTSLCGVYLECGSEHVTFTATDGHRLVTLTRDAFCESEFAGILRRDAVRVAIAKLKRVKKQPDRTATLTLGNTKGLYGTDATWSIEIEPACSVLSRAIEGPYPNYHLVIPDRTDRVTYHIDAEAFRDAVKIFRKSADNVTRQVRLGFGPDALLVGLPPRDDEELEGISVACKASCADSRARLGVNADYAVEVLRTMQGDTTLTYTSEVSALILENGESLALLMPLRIT
jgi:DNA polymerase-3 subunit beta